MKEFDIIKKYFRPLSKNNYGAMNLTDDVYFDLKKNIAISIDTYIENTIAGSKCVLVRLIGGEQYWPYGFDVI